MIAYRSTRGDVEGRGFEEVLLTGLAPDGGLFVPERWPHFTHDALRALAGRPYAETTARLLAPFTAGCFDAEELGELARRAYAGFGHAAVAPLRQLEADSWLLELFHGPTLAFKDFALQLLGLMFETVLLRRDERITVVGATSGDTGAAAIRALSGLERVRIVILHPQARVSEVQRRQMTTVTSRNVRNVAIRGDFDDCQSLVKAMFGDAPFRKRMRLAAINSINWARIVAQAAYYVFAALRLGGLERPLSFAVPTGNFGDVYAGYVAHRIGLPVRRLIVATNRNDILARFLETGRYEAGWVTPTISPSMDIQVASNFERLLLEMVEGDGKRVAEMMQRFKDERSLSVEDKGLREVRQLFAGAAVSEEATRAALRASFQATGLLVDPHTAVGLEAARAFEGPMVTLATAHPAKFPDAVEEATGVRPALPPQLQHIMSAEERYTTLPNDLAAVQDFIQTELAT